MKVALVYDRVNKWGGAERVLLSLHKIFPNAPLFTSVYDKKNAKWANVFKVKTSFLQKLPLIKSHHEFFSFLMPFAFMSFSFKNYDLVISVTSEFAKGIKINGKTKHLCICLTPTRYLWSGYDEYFKNNYLRNIASPCIWLLRFWDKKTAEFPNMFIAISEEVKKRIKKYYKRDSLVVYPSVPKIKLAKNNFFEKDYFLIVSRLSKFTSYKKVELAVKACTEIGASLVVIGKGNISSYKKFAGPTVNFVGDVTDKELSWFYSYCKALIFPAVEDFGLVMTEAMSFGKPVLAFKGGGALEIVQSGKTGTFFYPQTVKALVKTLKSFKVSKYNSEVIKKHALKFSEKNFRLGIRDAISKLN